MRLALVIAEYLRTLKERNELDRLLPDLLVEMGYVPIARPQTGNRQFGVDIATRGINPDTGQAELLLLVIKQKDIGRTEWERSDQAIRPSLNEVFDVYLKSHVEAEDIGKPVRIAVVTNGELKQTIQASWSGFVNDHKDQALIEFWGLDTLSTLIERHLLDEHVFHDEDRRNLRRALALAADVEYDQRDLHRMMLRTLGLNSEGVPDGASMSKKDLLKALRVVNFAAHAFASWALGDGDGRQGLRAIERALLWSWHRVRAFEGWDSDNDMTQALGSVWQGYLTVGRHYFEKLQAHCYVEDGLLGYASDSAELSLVAFEQIGMLASIGLTHVLSVAGDDADRVAQHENADTVAAALASLISSNGICNSPCFDRHSQDIVLGMLLLVLTGRSDIAKRWLQTLIRNIDYSFKAKRYVPIDSDSIDDLSDIGGWHSGQTADKLMKTSWMIAVLAGLCAVLGQGESYGVLRQGLVQDYPETCAQLWHPDKQIHEHLYFHAAHFSSGASEAPIRLPEDIAQWFEHMRVIVESEQGKECLQTMGCKVGLPAIDLIACRHFGTPVAPAFWYQLVMTT
ncbi:hypothetical protein [Rhodoferax sp.]|uniref:hypothetical protein n=1 Tax=Rhodoferax sp. TaxID=50421 RepID=UPI002728CFC1|nr:hypothetical protein [Rhodoferax sp.]MDO9144978.1 hypothetical protein [Rhodoferax sp.]MDP3863139.1 hypothetical protein [Rhodoferax sp.]